MSSRPWKDTNSRDKTNNINVIHCDELITDELTTKNATYNNLDVGQKVTTNIFDVSNVEITNTMMVPDISINNIGNKSEVSAVEFISPFSAPYAVFKDVRVNDTSMNGLVRGNDISVNIISSFDNSSIKIISDVSFNANITSQFSSFNNIYSDNELQINSDVSCNGNIIVNTISLEILQHINDGIIQVINDISVDRITVIDDVSVNILDTSLIEVSVIDNLYSDKIAFNSNTIIDGSANINDLSVNSLESHKNNSIEFKSNVDASQNVNIKGNIKTNILELETSFNNDVSFDTIKADISVNKINNYNLDTIIIDCDVSINNSSVLSATTINQEDINFMNVYEQNNSNNNKSSVRSGTIFFFNNDDINSVLFKNYMNNYLVLKTIGSNVIVDLSYIELYDNSYNSSEYQLRNYGLNHEQDKYEKLDASWNSNIDENKPFEFKSINIRHDVSRNYKLDISAMVYNMEDPDNPIDMSNQILIIPTPLDISLNIVKNGDGDYIIPPGDTSFVFITPIVHHAYDVSFRINVSDKPRPGQQTNNNVEQIITFEYNRQPEWKYMILTPSNDTHTYDPSIGLHESKYDQSWNTTEWYSDINVPNKTIDATYSYDATPDVSYTFLVQMINGEDASYFHMDLSSIDPEGYDVSYFNFSASGDDHYGYTPDIANHLDVSGFIQNNTTDWSLSTIDGSRVTIRVPEPGNNGNGIDMSFEIISKDNYLDRQNYQKKIVNVKKINRQPEWNHMTLSAKNSDVLISDQSWNTTSNPSIRNSGDLSNQFYLYFDHKKYYVYSDGITDLSHYYLDLSALDFEGFDVSYQVTSVKGDLSLGFVDKSRIVVDISDTVVSGSDTSLQIISIDDWVNRPNPEKRIVKFKHISSKVITGFDLSYDATSIFRAYNITDNIYSCNDLGRGHITIEPSYQSIYSTYFDKYDDYSVNDITSSDGDPTNDVDTEIKYSNNKKIIDISTSIYGDISFSFILNYLFKYNFTITIVNKAITREAMDVWVNTFNSNSNGTGNTTVTDEYGPIEKWTTSQVTDMSYMFYNVISFNKDISAWNTSSVTNMQSMFYNVGDNAFQNTISGWVGAWNISNVTNTYSIFYAKPITRVEMDVWVSGNETAKTTVTNEYGPIKDWNTSQVTDMNNLFNNALNNTFDEDISGWDTSSVTDMNYMFFRCYKFNQDIGGWDTSNVTDMNHMFNFCSEFNQYIGSWETGAVTNMSHMFWYAGVFDQDIGGWDTSNVTDMSHMFQETRLNAFNQDISDWNTGNVKNMRYMFAFNETFNQDIGGWDTSKVTNMSAMFAYALAFDQDIRWWNVGSVTNSTNFSLGASSFAPSDQPSF